MRERNSPPTVTIVTPVFNEASNLQRYADEVRTKLLARADYNMRVLFVDDGSRDASWRLIRQISAQDRRFQGLRLSRNFGSHIALSAGITQARGDAVATLACDLQDPPETILEFLREWREGAAVVWGKRRRRADARWRVGASRVFERLARHFAMPARSKFTTGSFLLVDRRVARCFRQLRETNRITFALVAWMGFEQRTVKYNRQPRLAGLSSWTLGDLFKTSCDMFVGFSSLPIRCMTWLGVGLWLLTIPFAIYLLGCWAFGRPQSGWTILMLGMTFLFGIQFFLMSVLGEYLYRIYAEVVRRPMYFVSDRTIGLRKRARDAA